MSQKDEESINKISRMLEIGGTMLAQHCSECGAPLFRYKGNVICPVCDTGQKPSVQAQEKQADLSSIIAGSVEARQVISSADAIPSASVSPTEVKSATSVSSEASVQCKAISGLSLSDLEEIMITKAIMLARSMQPEQDPRRIKEFLDLIEKSLDVLDRLKK
ncbi:Sjogren's syndrome/scleroderma autoantigen 1 family protein [Methanomethylovorans sp.]|uniref:Sjogren's syndrome/scleroderma autoantigen 1 family protein n=1 Tax=Methanomethylovorans sp. TaxID=2758717 RepID=UPI00351C1407